MLYSNAPAAIGKDKADDIKKEKIYKESGHGSKEKGARKFQDLPAGSCTQCHTLRGATGPREDYSKGLFFFNDNRFCYNCHRNMTTGYPAREMERGASGFFNKGRWPGANVYDNSTHGKHKGVVYSSKDYNHGDCKNCHNPHGTANNAMLHSPYDKNNLTLCFDCHSERSAPAGMRLSSTFIEAYYTLSLTDASAPGHRITKSAKQKNDFTNSKLSLGDKLPCYDCHNPHGSIGGSGRPNASLISDQRYEWDDLKDTRNEPHQSRKFCLACHVESDGSPFSRQIEGILMNRIPILTGAVDEHSSKGKTGCHDCHGRDYSTSESLNVHNIGYGKK